MFQFRDPVHGFIEISEDELKIINSAPFQRLRNIHQLATTYLVYHGAEHKCINCIEGGKPLTVENAMRL